jgi:hypothetical protein
VGKWSTYRRRGSKPSGADVLPLPLTPVLTAPFPILSTTAAGGNTGGTVTLHTSPTEFGDYSIADTKPWTTVTNFGTKDVYAGFYVKSQNVGDGRNFSNQSAFSNALFIAA